MSCKLKKSFIYLALSNFFFMLAGYIIHIVLGRSLGPSDYGIFAVVVSLFSTANLILTAGLPGAVSKYIAEDETKAKTILIQSMKIQVTITVIITTLYYMSASALASLLNDPALIPLIQLSTIVIPVYALSSIYTAYYNGQSRFKLQALLQTILSIVKASSILYLAYRYSLHGAIAGYAAAPLAILILAFIIDKKQKITLAFNYKKLIRFAIPVTIFTVSYSLFTTIDLFLIKALLQDNALAGIYNANLTIGRIPYYLLGAIAAILLPQISKSTSTNNLKRTKQLIHSSLRYIMLILVPVTFMISASSQDLITLLYTDKYLAASAPLSIFVFAVAFQVIFFIMASILNGAGKERTSMAIAMSGLAVSAAINYILIPRYGLIGAASASTIASLMIMVASAYFVYKNFKRLMDPKSAMKIILSSSMIYLFLKSVSLSIFISYPIAVIIYILLLFAAKEITREEIAGYLHHWCKHLNIFTY